MRGRIAFRTAARALTIASICTAISTAHQAGAQSIDDLYGTVNVRSHVVSSAGRQLGCSLEFNAFIRDHTYKRGAPVSVNGSISIMRQGDGLGLGLKLVLNDVIFSASGSRLIPSPPFFVYLRSPSGVANADELLIKAASDTPGGLFSVFRIGDKFGKILEEMIETSQVTVVYNRSEGGLDTPINLDLDVVASDDRGKRTRLPGSVEKFIECAGTLAQ